MSLLEWMSAITGLVYVFLAARNNWSCWIWGIISCAILGYLSFTKYLLYADSLLQGLYVLMGFWGLHTWHKKQGDVITPIKKLAIPYHVIILIVGLDLSYISGLLLATYTPAFATYLDSATTIFGIIATYLLINKYIGNWIYWIIIDIVMAILYIERGGILPGVLMIIYTFFAIYGCYKWKTEIGEY